MLTCVKIDNFRGFDKFELSLGAKHLIMGPSGSGKTTLFEVFGLLRDFVIRGLVAEDLFKLEDRTRWLSSKSQRFELETTTKEGRYWYRLIVEPDAQEKPQVVEELLQHEGSQLLRFKDGEVLLSERDADRTRYRLDSHRSALATINPKPESAMLNGFKDWLDRVYCLRPDPRVMTARAEKEESFLESNGRNFAAFYRHWVQEDAAANADFQAVLKEVIERFGSLDAVRAGQNVRILTAKMRHSAPQANGRSEFDLSFSEFSDGERQLIFLYFVAMCIVPHASTILIDEADNYLPLAEIQPWLNMIDEAVEKKGVQLLLISHHPELLDQWATAYGIRFDRNEKGAVTAGPFSAQSQNGALTPSELVARGWDNE